MSIDEFTDWVCVAIGDFSQAMKNRIQSVLPRSVSSVMYGTSWECMTLDTEIPVTSGSWTNFPGTIFRPHSLYRSGYTKEIEWIPIEEYDQLVAASTTPYGREVCRYTVKGSGTLATKRFYWLDKPTGSYTIKGTLIIKINTSAIQNIPEHFYDAIRAVVIESIIPRMLEGQGGQRIANPNYPVVYGDVTKAMGNLKTIEGGRKGRSVGSELDDVAKRAIQHYHP